MNTEQEKAIDALSSMAVRLRMYAELLSSQLPDLAGIRLAHNLSHIAQGRYWIRFKRR